MYSLREVLNTQNVSPDDSGQLVSNFFLGDRYTHISAATNKYEYDKAFESWFGRKPKDKDMPCKTDDYEVTCGGFVSDVAGRLHPLYRGREYYIVMPNGTTFERLSV